jgi:hypothetical protein
MWGRGGRPALALAALVTAACTAGTFSSSPASSSAAEPIAAGSTLPEGATKLEHLIFVIQAKPKRLL